MTPFFKKYRYHLLLIFTGLFCLQTLNLTLQLDNQSTIYPDSYNYLEAAQNLYLKFSCHNYRPLGMAFITGFPYLFGSSDSGIFKWSFVVNVLCWIGTSLVLFQILKTFVREKIAFWFAILSFGFIGMTAINYHLLTENIFVFFMASTFYFIFKFYKTKSYFYLSVGLSILFLSMLVKPGIKFFAIIAGLYFLKVIVKNFRAKSNIFLYAVLLLVLIQIVAMKVKYGDYTISYIDGVTYHICICSKAECYKSGKEYDQGNNPRADYLFSLPYSDQKKFAAADLKNQIVTNSPNLFKAYLTGLIDNFKTGSTCITDLKNTESKEHFSFWKESMFNVSKWQNRMVTFLGILLSVFFLVKSYRKRNEITIVSLFVLYIILISGVSGCQGDRYNLVTFPFAILLLAKFVSEKGFKPSSEPLQK